MINSSKLITILFLLLIPFAITAHHNPIVYNGKKEIKITGTVTNAKFGYPHSRYTLNVKNEQDEIEKWTLITEDPKDAERLGFADAIKSIKKGDEITVIGWPHRFKPREIRGHQLHYPDGSVVMMRRGNYIWTRDIRVISRLRNGEEEFDPDIKALDPSLSPTDRLLAMIKEDKIIQRIAFEIVNNTALLFGFDDVDAIDYPGVEKFMMCHTEREDFTTILNYDKMTEQQGGQIYENQGFVRRYNGLLSRYWEQDIESC